jgi:hypothetical protein
VGDLEAEIALDLDRSTIGRHGDMLVHKLSWRDGAVSPMTAKHAAKSLIMRERRWPQHRPVTLRVLNFARSS